MREITQDEAIGIRKSILDAFHALCREHDLRYSLGYGTLLGAVRHKGMIPWDDDVDVVMPRSDYDRLEAMYSASDCTDRYQFVSHRNHPEIKTKIGYFIDFATRMEVAGTVNEYHGVHIDVYPIDVLPPAGIEREKYLKKRRRLHFLIAAKDVHPELFRGRQKWIRQAVKLLFAAADRDKLLDDLNSLAKKYQGMPEEQKQTVCCFCETGSPQCFPYRVIMEYELYDYDGKQYYGFKDYDAPLRSWYGEYMTPPPLSERRRPEHKWVRCVYKDLNADEKAVES